VGHVTPTWPLLTNFAFLSLELTAVRLRAKFEVSSFNHSRDIRGFQKFQKWVTWPPHDPFWLNFAFFSLELTAIRLHAIFAISSFNHSRDIRGSPKFQKWVTWPPHDPFCPILHFFRLNSLPSVSVPNLKFLALTIREILGGPKIPKVGHVTPTWPLLSNFAFFSFELTAVRLCAKFEVSSFNHSWDIRGPKIPKVGHVTPRWHLLT